MFLRGSTGAVLGLALLHATVAGAVSPAARCVAAKLKVAGKYSFCRLKTDAKVIRTGARADYTVCDSAFALKWARAEANGGGLCPPAADKLNVQNQLLADAAFILQKITNTRFFDNGDGTVTDLDTGLMWEKKDDLRGIHDAGDVYTWSATGTAPDGTAFTTFLATLNNGLFDGTTLVGCFAGHCDWRLPTLPELLAIIDLNAPGCASVTDWCIDPALQPLASGFAPHYWSSTTDANSPSDAWAVRFFYLFASPPGGVISGKSAAWSVRAVRGGS
jgi:hypothetical protein